MSDELTLDLLGDRRTIGPGGSVTFGRRADLVVDENPFMHRIVGRVTHREDIWWLQNHGSSLRVHLFDPVVGVDHELAPGQQLPGTATVFHIRFRAGATAYEIDGERSGPRLVLDDAGEVVGTATMDFGAVPLSPEQHLLMVALYDSAQRNGGVPEGNAMIAARLGWTPKKFHRKLDAVCEKLHRQGVRGVKGTTAGLAETRRSVLVDHAVNAGLVGPGDLGLLRPRPVDPSDLDVAG
jgi:hypothetical protein